MSEGEIDESDTGRPSGWIRDQLADATRRMDGWPHWKKPMTTDTAPRESVETIVAAAIRLPVYGVAGQSKDHLILTLPPPARHHHILHTAEAIGFPADIPLHDQGFLTSTGRFVRRFEARDLARLAGQLKPEAEHHDRLYSEDVW